MKQNVVEGLETSNHYLEKLILRKEFRILKLGINEMNLHTRERLIPNNLYRIELISGSNEKIKLTAKVISSFFKGVQKVKDDTVPIYEVSLKFTRMNEYEINFLKNLISEFINRAKNSKKN